MRRHPVLSAPARVVFAVTVVVASGVFLIASPAAAQFIGPEFQINTYTTGDQAYPAVAVNAAKARSLAASVGLSQSFFTNASVSTTFA